MTARAIPRVHGRSGLARQSSVTGDVIRIAAGYAGICAVAQIASFGVPVAGVLCGSRLSAAKGTGRWIEIVRF